MYTAYFLFKNIVILDSCDGLVAKQSEAVDNLLKNVVVELTTAQGEILVVNKVILSPDKNSSVFVQALCGPEIVTLSVLPSSLNQEEGAGFTARTKLP